MIPGSSNLRGSPSARRLLGMRLTAIVAVPILLLGILELGLRLIGSGYSTEFFQLATIDGEDYFFTNHRFTNQFFPPDQARSAIPLKFKAKKDPDTYRIFIFGESAANGDPEPAYGFGRHLEILLQERFPETTFEVINTAVTAINSHVILPVARECADLEGDLWIIYMGNNEMVGPYGPSTVFGAKAPKLTTVRLLMAIKRTRIGQLIESIASRARSGNAESSEWAGINMFSENLLRSADPGRLQAYDNFRANLSAIIKSGEDAGIPVLLSSVGSNLVDSSPFASLHDEGLSDSRMEEWNALFSEGKELAASGSTADALKTFEAAEAIDGEFAELHYFIGFTKGVSGDAAGARKALERSRDLDGLVVRADSSINRIIREAGAAGSGIHFIDSMEQLAEASPNGIPGKSLFYEHVHFTLEGNYRLARIFAGSIAGILPASIRNSDTGSWASPGTCLKQLAVTLWDRHRIWKSMGERLSTPPYTARTTNQSSLAHCQAMMEATRSRINIGIDRKIYEMALEKDPDDFHLRYRFAHFLTQTGSFDEAVQQWQWVCETFPEFEGGFHERGIALALANRFDEAEESFKRVLEIRPGYPPALHALDLVEEKRKQADPNPS